MEIEIESLKKVKLDPEDVLVVIFNNEMSSDALVGSMEVLKTVFPKNKVLFNPSDIFLKVYSLKEIPEDTNHSKIEWIKKERVKTGKSLRSLNREWNETHRSYSGE